MREIKFRAWIDSGDGDKYMVYQDEMGGLTDFMFMYGDSPNLMQWTGLKDNSGRDIYEGDIVIGWNGIEYLVMWQTDRYTAFDFKAWDKGYYDAYIDLSHIGQVGMDNTFTNDKVKVAGNSHENPKLLPANCSK